jgi:hypothetical protein
MGGRKAGSLIGTTWLTSRRLGCLLHYLAARGRVAIRLMRQTSVGVVSEFCAVGQIVFLCNP